MILYFSLDCRLVMGSIQLKEDSDKQLDIENLYFFER